MELVLRRFLRHRLAVGSLVLFLLIILFAFVGPLLWKYDYAYIDGPSFSPPSAEHPLGTDQAGHDLLGQSMRGTQQSLKISLLVALIATTFGALVGRDRRLLPRLGRRRCSCASPTWSSPCRASPSR